MRTHRWETVSAAVAVALLFFTAYGNALLLAVVSGVLLLALLAVRFLSRDEPRPGWLVAASVIGFALAIAIVWLIRGGYP